MHPMGHSLQTNALSPASLSTRGTPVWVLSLALTIMLLASGMSAAADFPLRAQYAAQGVEPISTDDLAARFDDYLIIDARARYEFETLHIEGAHSMPFSDRNFSREVLALHEEDPRPMVFYCNGVECAVSYRAAARAVDRGISNALVYDAGVFAWANAQPGRTLLLGEPLNDPGKLISQSEFQAHLLGEEAFFARIEASENPIILDVRTTRQREGVSLFQMQDVHVPLQSSNREILEWVDRAIAEERALFVADATGRQVRWLQYLLESRGVSEYWFLDGGAQVLFSEYQF